MEEIKGNLPEQKRKLFSIRSFLFTDTLYAILGAASSAAWIIFFGLGMLIDSKPYRDAVAASFNWSYFMMAIMVYTPTNIFILCVISSFVGGCASRLIISRAQKVIGSATEGDASKTDDSLVYMNENPFSSLLRGVVVFFAFLAGVFVSNSNLFVTPTAQGYTQAAGVVSLLSFLVGYDPTVFSSFLKVANKVQGKQ